MRKAETKGQRRSDLVRGGPVNGYLDDRPAVYRWACHGDPERCLWVNGHPMYLCSRCLGFYIGLLPGLIMGYCMSTLGVGSIEISAITLALLAPLIVDGLGQYLKFHRSNNALRLITGLMAGTGAGSGTAFVITDLLMGGLQ